MKKLLIEALSNKNIMIIKLAGETCLPIIKLWDMTDLMESISLMSSNTDLVPIRFLNEVNKVSFVNIIGLEFCFFQQKNFIS